MLNNEELKRRENLPKSITPSGFFGNSKSNIVELKNFISEEERLILLNFISNNNNYDETETHLDPDGLVLYDANVWANRVCGGSKIREQDLGVYNLLYSLINKLKVHVSDFFQVEVTDTGPTLVRWPVETRQEPHADKEFHLGKEEGRPNDFPWYDIASLFYLNDDYEGGELYFPQHGIEFKPNKGSAYFFPGDKNYTHGVRPVKSGTRYTCPFFWTITKHTGEKQPPINYIGGFQNPEYLRLIEENK